MPRLTSNIFNVSKSKQTKRGNAGYDNIRENIDPHVRTQAVTTKEIIGDSAVINGNISGASLNIVNTISGANIYSSGSISGANIYSSGSISGAGLITGKGIIDSSLVGYWHMDDNAANTTVKDCSGYGNDGTFNDAGGDANTDAHSVIGKIGRALEFDGVDDYVDLGDVEALDLDADFTISAWIKPLMVSDYRMIMSKSTALSSSGGGWMFRTEDSYLKIYLLDGAIPSPSYASPVSTISINKWQHVVVTRTGTGNVLTGQIKMYYDGAEVSGTESNYGTSILNNDRNVGIGIEVSDLLNDFNGSIDEVKIYNRSLSAEEIAELYRKGSLSHGGTITESLAFQNITTPPATISGAGIQFVSGGALFYKGSSGTETKIANS